MANKRKKRRKFLNRMKFNLRIFVLFAVVFFGVLAIRLIYINVKGGKKYEQQVLAQQHYTNSVLPFKRGDIVDANGTVLATSKQIYKLIIEPHNILNPINKESTDVTINAIKKYFNISDEKMSECLSNPNSFYQIVRTDVEYEEKIAFEEFMSIESDEDRNGKDDNGDRGELVVGVYFEEGYVRTYPNGELACHVIGFSNRENQGQCGLELSYNDELNGYNGREYTYLNNDMSMTKNVEAPVDGNTIITSIDANIQTIIKKKVDEYMATEGAKNVSVMVMNPNNCNIMAMYNAHSFDLNDPYDIEKTRYDFEDEAEFERIKASSSEEDIKLKSEALNKLWRNFQISDVFEPGSTYKTFVIAGALEESIVNEEDTFYCDGGEKKDIYYIKCHAYKHGGHGMLTLSGALENSCNDALMQIAAKEGAEIFDKYQVLFGFGKRTNIDLPGEPSSASLATLLYHANYDNPRYELNVTELATSSFGQGVSCTMMELATAFCSVINGGYYYEPSVVQRIEDANGNVTGTLDSVLVRRTVSEDVSKTMREELFQVVEKGTGKRASVEGYEIGGKTATAQKGIREDNKWIISFIGFAPVNNPQVVIYVVVDEPNVEDQSSSAASSYIFSEIAAELLPYLNIYKTNDNYDLDLNDVIDEPAETIFEGEVPENILPDAASENTEAATEENTEASMGEDVPSE